MGGGAERAVKVVAVRRGGKVRTSLVVGPQVEGVPSGAVRFVSGSLAPLAL